MNEREERSKEVKRMARELGFAFCGVSEARKLEEHEASLTKWLNRGMHGKMQWMENHFEKRLDPRLLVPGAKSVISLLFNYYPQHAFDQENLKISKYAYGRDYHFVIKDKLKDLMHAISTRWGQVNGRVFVDSAPVLDRAWAANSGLGWIGKNSMLITKSKGSYYFIAELILDIDLAQDGPTTDHCGTCTACIDACPTDAIVGDKVIDSNRCISYLTIELKEEIPSHFKGNMEGWVFGCDICQDVCPWNRFAQENQEDQFVPHPALQGLHQGDWEELTQEVFQEVFKKSAVKRAGYVKLKKSIQFCKDNEPG